MILNNKNPIFYYITEPLFFFSEVKDYTKFYQLFQNRFKGSSKYYDDLDYSCISHSPIWRVERVGTNLNIVDKSTDMSILILKYNKQNEK